MEVGGERDRQTDPLKAACGCPLSGVIQLFTPAVLSLCGMDPPVSY